LKNHDYPTLANFGVLELFWEWVLNQVWGYSYLCWFLDCSLCRVALEVVLNYKNEKHKKRKENKIKEKEEKQSGYNHCVRNGIGSKQVGIAFALDFDFFLIAPLFHLVLRPIAT